MPVGICVLENQPPQHPDVTNIDHPCVTLSNVRLGNICIAMHSAETKYGLEDMQYHAFVHGQTRSYTTGSTVSNLCSYIVKQGYIRLAEQLVAYVHIQSDKLTNDSQRTLIDMYS